MPDLGIFAKPISQLDESDLRDLVEHRRVREHLHLDYKRDPYDHNRDKSIEMLADVTAMANAGGGYLVIGVEEDTSAADGTPKALLGIFDGEAEATWIQSVCTSSIDERIPGLHVRAVPLVNGRACVIVHVPNSPRKPHVINYQKHHSFRIRSARDKRFMNMQEVRDMLIAMTGYRAALSQFLDERRRAVATFSGDKQAIAYMATPIFVDQEKINPITDQDLRALIDRPPATVDRNYEGITGVFHSNPYPQLFGIEASIPGRRSEYPPYQIARLFRNGHLEFLDAYAARQGATKETTKRVDAYPTAVYLLQFLDTSRRIAEVGQVNEPWAITIHWCNIAGAYLYQNERSAINAGLPWPDPTLTIDLTIPTLDDPTAVTRTLLERLYNAFGFKHCPLFDENDALRIQR